MQKPTFNKGSGSYSKGSATKPAQHQAGAEPDPAGNAGARTSADAQATSTPKAGERAPDVAQED